MVYKKRRYYRKKNTRKFNKYAYAKTDSKNQAKQIVRLNKKINRVYNTVKPELYNVHKYGYHDLTQESSNVLSFFNFMELSGVKGLNTKTRYFNFRLFVNPGAEDYTQGKSFRIIIFQNKKPLSELPVMTDILDNPSGGFGMCASFKQNITIDYKILLSKVLTIPDNIDHLYRSYNFKKLISLKKIEGDTATFPRGCIFVALFVLSAEPASKTAIRINWVSNYGYTDN